MWRNWLFEADGQADEVGNKVILRFGKPGFFAESEDVKNPSSPTFGLAALE